MLAPFQLSDVEVEVKEGLFNVLTAYEEFWVNPMPVSPAADIRWDGSLLSRGVFVKIGVAHPFLIVRKPPPWII